MQLIRIFLVIGCATATFYLGAPARAAENAEAVKLAHDASEAAKAKDWNKAVEEFKRAAEIDGRFKENYFAALVQRGAALREQSKFPESIADFSEALKIRPDDADTHERRAYAEMQLKDYDKALADYTAAIKADPKEVRVYLLRSYLYEIKGDVKNGIADCDTILKLQPGNPEASARKTRLEAKLHAPPPAPTLPPGPIANPNLPPGGRPTPTPTVTRKNP